MMDNSDISTRSLEGPYRYHLYIGYSPANKKSIFALHTQLEKRGVSCYLRDVKDSIQRSIQEGVGTSQKCLLFLTPDYMKDDWYTMETSAVIEKSQRFSRDIVIILKGRDLEEIPENLREFTTQEFKPEKLNDEKFLAQFVDAITREPNVMLAVLSKQNIGYGSALGYFYGFLRLVLPDFKKRLIEETLRNDPNLVPKTVQKMLIIMPESCFCATELQVPGNIEFTGKFVVRVANRAGNQKRDYKSSLYKLIDHERGQVFYFVGELATPLLTMYEMQINNLCGMTQDQLYAERDGFYYALKAVLSHPDNAECNDQFKLLYWSDPETGKPNQLDLYKLLLPVLRDEIQQQNDKDPTRKVDSMTPLNVDSMSHLKTFETVPVAGSNPVRAYDSIGAYPMNRRPRGVCLIVNIVYFNNGLQNRKGAQQDEVLLTKLFEKLHFKVEVCRSPTAQSLESQFVNTHRVDHSNYDAFVCCIGTHGRLGVIYTSDGKKVEILSLVNFFTDRNCPTLKGKPKMFFIQACQTGDPEQESETAGNSPPDIGSTGYRAALPSSQNAASKPQADVISDPTLSMHDDILPTTFRHKAVLVPGSPDFLMSYSTLPGTAACRHEREGSYYIQELDECLRTCNEIDTALKRVSAGVKKKLGEANLIQLPFHLTSGMDRLIYL